MPLDEEAIYWRMGDMLYRIDPRTKEITSVVQVRLASLGLLETNDLENWIASSRSILDRELLWISRQDWATDVDRSDLVGVAADAELLIVELKRDLVDSSALTQALNYAAEYASMSHEALIAKFVENSTNESQPLFVRASTEEEADRLISDLTAASQINDSQVIVLIGAQFDPKVLSMCEYLNRSVGLDSTISIECWQISLYKDGDALYLSLTQIVPTPDLKQQIEALKTARQAARYRRDPDRIRFMWQFRECASKAGFSVSRPRGGSYFFWIDNVGGPTITLDIHGDPHLHFPIESGYNLTDFTEGRILEEENRRKVVFDPIRWSDRTACESLLKNILDDLAKLRPRPVDEGTTAIPTPIETSP